MELSPSHENNSWWEWVGQAESVKKSWKTWKLAKLPKFWKITSRCYNPHTHDIFDKLWDLCVKGKKLYMTWYTWTMTFDTWHVTYDTWHMTSDTWHLTGDMKHRNLSPDNGYWDMTSGGNVAISFTFSVLWQVPRLTPDRWQWTPDLTCDTWHLTPDMLHLRPNKWFITPDFGADIGS